jgi:hypothetical protein
MTSTVFGTLYLCAVIVFHRGCEPVRHIVQLVREMTAPSPFEPASKG